MWNFYRYVNFPQFFVIASKTVLLSTKPVVQPKVEQLSFHYFLTHSMYPINCSIIWQTNRLPENNFSFDDKYWCWCIFAYSGKFKSLLSSFNGKYSYMHALNSLTYLTLMFAWTAPKFPINVQCRGVWLWLVKWKQPIGFKQLKELGNYYHH